MNTTNQRGHKQSKPRVNRCKRYFLDSTSASWFTHPLPGSKQQTYHRSQSLNAAENIERLQSNNISFVLSIKHGNVARVTREAYRKARISHVHIIKKDDPKEDFLSILEPVCDMIEGILSRGKSILVHCTIGKSRSATVVIAYCT